MRYDAILFDFDGVLLESELSGNSHLVEYLRGAGHPIDHDEAMARFMGRAGTDFLAEIESFLGRPIPQDFHDAREIENARVLAEGIEEVAGAVAFVRSLPPELPRAITSSSSTHWISTHLTHLGLRDAFGDRIFSGREHVTRGKPAPDLYLYAAEQLGVPIGRCVILEDSPVGATGAVASGAHVIGLCAGQHCPPNHAEVLRRIGVQDVAADFEDVARLVA